MLFSPKPLPSLLYHLVAFNSYKHQSFGFVSLKDGSGETPRKRFHADSKEPTVLIFKDDVAVPDVVVRVTRNIDSQTSCYCTDKTIIQSAPRAATSCQFDFLIMHRVLRFSFLKNCFKQNFKNFSISTGQKLFLLVTYQKAAAFGGDNGEILIPEILFMVSHLMLICSSGHLRVVMGPS